MGWHANYDVGLLSGSNVAAIDTAARTAALCSGKELAYQKVLIVTAGQNRRLAIVGAGLPGIGYLRTIADRDAIKQQAAKVSNGWSPGWLSLAGSAPISSSRRQPCIRHSAGLTLHDPAAARLLMIKPSVTAAKIARSCCGTCAGLARPARAPAP